MKIIFEKVFDVIDSSDDNKIDKNEFEGAKEVLKKIELENLTFEEIDSDNSGSITIDEFMNIILKIIEKMEIEKNGPEFLEEENKIERARPETPEDPKLKNRIRQNNNSDDEDINDFENTMDLKKKEY